MKITAFWNITKWSLVQVDIRFGALYCLLHQAEYRETTRRNNLVHFRLTLLMSSNLRVCFACRCNCKSIPIRIKIERHMFPSCRLHCYCKISRCRAKHCAYCHIIATLVNPRGVNNSFPQEQCNSCKTCNCGSGCSFYRTLPSNYKIKIYYLRRNLKM
jgi:hypothetical protein